MMKTPVSLRDGILWSLAAVVLLAAGSPLLQAQEDPLRTLYFPDYVDGGGWSVQLAISNIDPAENAATVVTAYDQEGQAIPGFFDFEGPFELPPLGTRVFRSAGAGDLRRGWIKVKADTLSVSGLLTYRNAGTGLEVSVESAELGNRFALFVEESSGIGTGLAIFKPDPASTIEFRIYGEDGSNPLGEGFLTHPVGGETFQQRVGSIPEWFALDGIDTEFLKYFRGILLLRAEDDSLFAPIGIRFGKQGESLSAVPVIRVTDSNLQIYNDNVFVLPVSENLATLWTRSGNSPPLQDYAARFYEHFNDEFDFLIFFANVLRREIELEPGSHDGAFFNHVKNDVQGIGLPDTFSDNSNWESAGKLQGVIFSSVYEPYHPIYEYSDFRQGQLLHELMHRWANFVVPTNFGAHWGPSSPGGVLGDDISNMIDHGDGKFSAINIRRVQFSPIELYLAGFIPPEEVPDFQIAEDVERLPLEIVEDDKGPIANFIFTASGIKTYTIEDIIAEHGPRVPGHLQAQKDFRAAVILLVSEDYPATREILESVSDDVLWFSHAGEVGLEKGALAGSQFLRSNRRQRYDHHGRSVAVSKPRSRGKAGTKFLRNATTAHRGS